MKQKIFISLSAIASIGLGLSAIACSGANQSGNPGSNNPVNGQGELQERRANSLLGANPEGQNNAFQQDKKEKIVLAANFLGAAAQANALVELANAYNSDPDIKTKYAGFFKPVEVEQIGSTYSDGAKKVAQYLKAKNKSAFYNLVLNHPSVAAELAKSNMLLSFNDSLGRENLDTDVSLFSSLFTDANTNTENIKNPSTYILPVMKSTMVSSVNGPVLYYILKTMVDNGATLSQDKDTQDFYNALMKTSSSDLEFIKQKWGNPVDNARTLVTSANLTISKDMFNKYEDLLNFAMVAQKLFTNSANNQNDLHIVGMDFPTVTLKTSVFSIAGNDYSKSLEAPSKIAGTNKVSYNSLSTTGSPAQVAARTVYNKLKDAAGSGAVVLQPLGQYSSGKQIYHNFALSIGSTAGYLYNFIDDTAASALRFTFNSSLDKFSFDDNDNPAASNYNNRYFVSFKQGSEYLSASAKDKNKTNEVLLSFGKNNNALIASGGKTASGSDFHMVDVESDQALKTALAEVTKDGNQENYKLLILRQSSNDDNQLATMKAKVMNLASKDTKKELVYAGVAKGGSSSRPRNAVLVFVKTSNNNFVKTDLEKYGKQLGASVSQLTSANSLNKSELVVMNAPGKWNKNSIKNVAFLRGPSLIGIKANEEDDNATKAFVHWLVTNKKTYAFFSGKNNEVSASPSEFFQRQMSYLMPIAGFETSTTKFNNGFLDNALEVFSSAAKDPQNWTTYEPPGSELGDLFDQALDSAFRNLGNQALVNTSADKLQSFEAFVNSFTEIFGSSN